MSSSRSIGAVHFAEHIPEPSRRHFARGIEIGYRLPSGPSQRDAAGKQLTPLDQGSFKFKEKHRNQTCITNETVTGPVYFLKGLPKPPLEKKPYFDLLPYIKIKIETSQWGRVHSTSNCSRPFSAPFNGSLRSGHPRIGNPQAAQLGNMPCDPLDRCLSCRFFGRAHSGEPSQGASNQREYTSEQAAEITGERTSGAGTLTHTFDRNDERANKCCRQKQEHGCSNSGVIIIFHPLILRCGVPAVEGDII